MKFAKPIEFVHIIYSGAANTLRQVVGQVQKTHIFELVSAFLLVLTRHTNGVAILLMPSIWPRGDIHIPTQVRSSKIANKTRGRI